MAGGQLKVLDVIYDGQCGFCRRSLRLCRALDLRHVLRFHDANQRQAVAARFPELVNADLDEAMFVVTPRRRVYRGFFAFRRIARSLPPMWPLLPLFYAPGSRWAGPRVYAWVARNRYRLGCGSEVCELPPRPAPRRER